MNWNYERIKEVAKENGLTVRDLLALAPQNDAFYVGTPSQIAMAHWFADTWREYGYSSGVHLRRIHYRVVSQDHAVILPSGKRYENTEGCWNYLALASKYARYLGLVDPSDFVDRRNPEAKIHTKFTKPGDWLYEDATPGYEVTGKDDPDNGSPFYNFDLPSLPRLGSLPWDLPDLPDFEVSGYKAIQQDYLIEIWAEKTTQNDILIPLCQTYDVNLITGLGELSITAVIHFLDRVRKARRPARILYVSDFDPAGLGMPISVARKIEYYHRTEAPELNIRLEPVILTPDQVASYDLPRVPIKDSDKRKAGFEQSHGQGATELDALEALRPGEMRDIVERVILKYYDPSLRDRAERQRRLLYRALNGYQREVVGRHQSELDALESEYNELRHEFTDTRDEFDGLVADFQPKIDAHQERLGDIRERGEALHQAVVEGLEAVDVDAESEYPLPDADLPEEDDSLLYVSERDYLAQLDCYKSYRNGID